LPKLTSVPRDVVSVADYEALARARLDANAWAYLDGAAADEITAQRNRRAFDELSIVPRMLTDVSGGHTRVELFGHTFEHPILLAPVAYQRLFHPDGELASAAAADALQAGLIVSTLASTPLEAIAAQTRTPWWFQLYFQSSREHSLALVRRAEQCGACALVVTVDAAIAGIRNREQRAGFALPPDVSAVNLPAAHTLPPHPGLGKSLVFDGLMAQAPTWRDIDWLAQQTRLPLVIKGVLHPDDARLALDHGAQGVVVSNHGGRVLDTVPAAIDALPAVASAVGDRATVLLDGGIRRGSDVFKALALGARAVLLGRGYVHALAAAGALGVAHALRIVREELELNMALSGRATLAHIDRGALWSTPGVAR
jgi:4-hydroxymandelate oxidase